MEQVKQPIDPLEQIKALERIGGVAAEAIEHIRWMAQTVHQNHHPSYPGTWMDCPRGLCSSTVEAIREMCRKALGQ